MQSSFSLDSVQFIYDFFKLHPLNPDTVAVPIAPIKDRYYFLRFFAEIYIEV